MPFTTYHRCVLDTPKRSAICDIPRRQMRTPFRVPALLFLLCSRIMSTKLTHDSHNTRKKCEESANMENRLEILRKTLNMGWGELASAMGISRSMLDQVRKGTRIFSPKTARQLEELELKAGLRESHPPLPQPSGDLTGDIHTICTRLSGMEKALERMATALERLAASHAEGQEEEK